MIWKKKGVRKSDIKKWDYQINNNDNKIFHINNLFEWYEIFIKDMTFNIDF